MLHTRRGLGGIAVAGLPLLRALGAVESTFHGVRIGVQSASFTFRGLGLDDLIKTMLEVGIAETDVMSERVESYLGGPVALPGAGRSGPWARPAEGRATGAGAGAPIGAAGVGRGPDPAARDALRKWRLTTPLDGFHGVRKKFENAGPSFFTYNPSTSVPRGLGLNWRDVLHSAKPHSSKAVDVRRWPSEDEARHSTVRGRIDGLTDSREHCDANDTER